MSIPARVSEVRTEHLLTELLTAQGWDVRRPPNGELLRQQEYKDHSHLRDIFKGRGKGSGGGSGLPEAMLVNRSTYQPVAVIEAKAKAADLSIAIKEVKDYGCACVDAGFAPLAVAVAGTTEDDFAVRVLKWTGKQWANITYDGKPIGWIPNRTDMELLRAPSSPVELRPSIPSPEVLAERADEINRLLRESGVKDDARPGVVGAIMLALWQSGGLIRKEPEHILIDINQACGKAFWKAKKPDLAASLRVDEANEKLAVKARRIAAILERLNVTVLTAEHDYLGQLYETFFHYTGGNTIGQYFTPRHVAALMADLVDVALDDVVLDPACGTGGFLIASMNRVVHEHKLSRSQMVQMVKKNLVGFDSEPVTAALCVANMILRGDGSTGIHRGDAFTDEDYPINKATVVLMNPPFPHKKTDTSPERFVERALEGLVQGGRLAVIVPRSLAVKKDKRSWREGILKKNTLDGVIRLPDQLFQPYASVYPAILLLTKGVPHPANKKPFFARIENDGFRRKKNMRIPREGGQLSEILEAYRARRTIPGFAGWSAVADDGSWAPGAYIPALVFTDDEVEAEAAYLTRSQAAFATFHAPQLHALEKAVATGAVRVVPYGRGKAQESPIQNSIGALFIVGYGQKTLHSKEGLAPGVSPVISSSGTDNGCYGFFDFEALMAPPFVTIPSTGSIGEAHVQEWPCGVADDALILVPKKGVDPAMLYVAAAVMRQERWRFEYGRKVTPDRIASFLLPSDSEFLERVRLHIAAARAVRIQVLENAEDIADAVFARTRLAEIEADPKSLISGHELERRLSALEQ